MPKQKLDTVILDIIEQSNRNLRVQPLNLGGLSGAGGGVGTRAGGYVGQLPQKRVTYDSTEAATLDTPASGMSLVDNLNHIRYRVGVLESGGSLTIVDDTMSTTYPDVSELHFDGSVSFTDLGGGAILVDITGGGGGDGTYLRLDTANKPLTDTLEINPPPGNTGLGVFTQGDAYGLDLEQNTVDDNIDVSNLFLYRTTNGNGNIIYSMIEGIQYEFGAGTITGDWITLFHNDNIEFQVLKGGTVNIASGQTYNIDGIPHTHDGSSAAWGLITGTLSDQTDLQDALDAKQDSLGFTPEDVANKSLDVDTDQASNVKYPSVKAVFDWVTSIFLPKNAPITGDTKTKITYDSNGLVLSGADATLSDISGAVESVQDIVGDMVDSNVETGISVTYDDAGGKLDFVTLQHDWNQNDTGAFDYINNRPLQYKTPCIVECSPFSADYDNGVSGVGATLTCTTDGEFSEAALNDRVLVSTFGGGGSGYKNGVYVVTDIGSVGTPFVLTRATDFDESVELNYPLVPVKSSSNSAYEFRYGNFSNPTIGTTALGFGATSALPVGGAGGELFGSYPTPSLGNSAVIGKVLTAFSAGAGTVDASDSILSAFQKVVGNIALKLTANAPITGATKTKITYDANGLVTSGADATTSDVADSSDKRYVTDANLVVIGNTSGTNSGNETTTTVGSLINGATAKTTPVDADYVGLMDSAASNILKKLSWANIKATLKTYFDTLYQATGTYLTSANIEDSIVDAHTTIAPSGNAVFDALALKESVLTYNNTTVTTANVTTAEGNFYRLTIAGLTANRNFVLPAPSAAGKEIELYIVDGDDTYALLIIGTTGVSINGGSTATEWSRLFIAGEKLKLVSSSTTNWDVLVDGRISSIGLGERQATQSINNNSSTKVLLDAAVTNRGNIVDVTNSQMVVRRAGIYSLVGFTSIDNLDSGEKITTSVKVNSTSIMANVSYVTTDTNVVMRTTSGPKPVTLAAGDVVELFLLHTEGAAQNTVTSPNSPYLSVAELL